MTRKSIITVATCLLAWICLVVPARRLWGDEQVLLSATAAGLCIAATLVSLLAASSTRQFSPTAQLLGVLVGMLLRLGLVFLAGLFFYLGHPYFHGRDAFLYWLLVFYLITLVLEKLLVLQGRTAPADVADGAPLAGR